MLKSPATIGLEIAAKYQKGPTGIALAREITNAITAARLDSTDPTSDLAADNERLRDALLPFASLVTPAKREGTSGLYSLRFSDIERAQAVRRLPRSEGGVNDQ